MNELSNQNAWSIGQRATVGLVAGLGLALAACRPDPGLPSRADEAGDGPAQVRLIVAEGQSREVRTTLKPGEKVPATPTRTITPTRSPTATSTATPTATITPTGAASATPTPTSTVTRTPATGPDVPGMFASLKAAGRYRAHLSGPVDAIYEIDGPERMRIFVNSGRRGEIIAIPAGVYLRDGSYWRPYPNAPPELLLRPDARLAGLAGGKRTYTARGTARARAGRCQSWAVDTPAPGDPITLCVGPDGRPYAVEWPGGMALELYDFGLEIIVPEQVEP